MTPLLSVVISTKDRHANIVRLLESLRQQSYPNLEIVVVDDGSQPALPPLNVTRQIRHEASAGISVARNRGMEAAQGEYIVVLDDDTTLPDRTILERAVELASREQRLGAIGFRQLTPSGEVHYMQPAAGNQLCLASHFFGYGFLVNPKAVQEVGAFYSAFGYGQEEIELGYRLLEAGYAILYDPSLTVIHYEEPIGRDYRRIFRSNFRNGLVIVLLRYPLWLVIPGILRACVNYLKLTRGWKVFRMSDLMWALRSTVGISPRFLRDRRPIRFSTLRRAQAINIGTYPNPLYSIKQ